MFKDLLADIENAEKGSMSYYKDSVKYLKRETDKKRYLEALELISRGLPLDTLDFENKNE